MSSNSYKNIALIFGGGTGVRASTHGIPKQFVKVQGVPIIIRTISKFEKNKQIDAIVLVCVDGYQQTLSALVKDYKIHKVVAIVTGGRTGQESIYNGLKAVKELSLHKEAVVLMHDAVRPMIPSSLIDECIESVKCFNSGIAAVVCHETVASYKGEDVLNIFPRSQLVMLRAPQAFYVNDIWRYHELALADGKGDFTDSATLASWYGHNIHLVHCDSKNIKITYPEDIFVLKALLEAEEHSEIMGL